MHRPGRYSCDTPVWGNVVDDHRTCGDESTVTNDSALSDDGGEADVACFPDGDSARQTCSGADECVIIDMNIVVESCCRVDDDVSADVRVHAKQRLSADLGTHADLCAAQQDRRRVNERRRLQAELHAALEAPATNGARSDRDNEMSIVEPLEPAKIGLQVPQQRRYTGVRADDRFRLDEPGDRKSKGPGKVGDDPGMIARSDNGDLVHS
jgi:hypothetical protein